MNSAKLIAGLVVAIVLVVFGAQNTQAVKFHFLMFSAPSVPMVFALFLAALLGALLALIVAAPARIRRMRERHDLQSHVAAHDRAVPAATSDPSAVSSRASTPE